MAALFQPFLHSQANTESPPSHPAITANANAIPFFGRVLRLAPQKQEEGVPRRNRVVGKYRVTLQSFE